MPALNLKQLISIFSSAKEYTNAGHIATCLHGQFIVMDDTLYRLCPETVSYERMSNAKPLYLAMLQLMELSIDDLNQDDRETLTNVMGNSKRKTFMNSTFPKYKETVYTHLQKKSEGQTLDDYPVHHYHFRNGYLDFKARTFHPREQGKHFITRFVDRDYSPAEEDIQAQIRANLEKVFPKHVLDYILHQFYLTLIGRANKLQEVMFILGRGSTGKSTLMKQLEKALGSRVYFLKLPKDFFEAQNSKRDKQINSLIRIRPMILWVNEMSTNRLDTSLLKNCVDGEIETTQLYQDGFFDVRIVGMWYFTSNEMPNLSTDSGTTRRITAYHCERRFTRDPSEVDNKTVFLEDSDLLEKFTDQHCNALLDMLMSCDKPQPLPEEFKAEKDVIVNANDKPGEFINEVLTLTKNPDDRISKKDMTEEYNRFTNKHLSTLQVISDLRHRLDYKGALRSGGTRGCFVGVRFKTEEDALGFDSTFVEDSVVKARLESVMIENEELREKIRQLEALLQQNPPPQLIETSEPESSEELTEEDDDDEDFLEQAIQHVEKMKRIKPLQRPKTPKSKMLKRKKPKKGPFQTEVEVDFTFRVALGQ